MELLESRALVVEFATQERAAVLGWVCPADQIVNDIRMSNALFNGLGIAKIEFLYRKELISDMASRCMSGFAPVRNDEP